MIVRKPSARQALFCAVLSSIALAACGTDVTKYPKFDAPPAEPDAAVIYVYVTPDVPPPSSPTCACVCTDPCTCSCDCGTGEPIAVLMPGCVPPTTNREDAAAQPIADAPADALGQGKDAPSDPAAGKDVPPPSDPVADRTDAAPDLPPPDTRPCTTATCRCPASSVCAPTPLMSVPSISDYAALGFSHYFGTQAGFGIYSQETAKSNWCVPEYNISAGPTAPFEVDINYKFKSTGIFGSTSGDLYAIYYNWFSLLRQFTGTIDSCGCTGISLDIKGDITKPRPEATARITISDIVCLNSDGTPVTSDGGTGSDEQWRYDITQDKISADWKTIQIPLNSFYLASVRYNDQKLDLRCLQGFEINYQYNVEIWCGNGCIDSDIIGGSGHFEVRNLTTY